MSIEKPEEQHTVWPSPSGVVSTVKQWFERLRDTHEASDKAFARGAVNDNSLNFADPKRIVRVGSAVVIVFVVGFLGWSAFAPLDSALMAPGVIIVESHRKTIQHLEGGIVKSILVREGQLVRQGQSLLVLDDTQARATLDALRDEADSLQAQEARLLAERDGRDTIMFPPELLARASDPKVAQIIQGEENAFNTRRLDLQQQESILRQRIDENGRVIAGFKSEQTALETQISLINQETGSVQQMVNKGLEPVPKLLALQREAADLTGQRGQLIEKIAQTELNTGETQLQIVNVKNQFLNDLLKDLRDVQSKRYDLQDRLRAALDILTRTSMIAPVAGKVVGLAIHTRGAVIRPGDTVMEIIPSADKLEAEAHLRPQDADQIYAGMTAKLSFSSYEARRLPMLTGIVTNVSADRLTDQRSGQSYFVATVSVDRSALKGYPDARIIPGMPVQIAIQNGQRTALDYFIEPVRDVMRRGMREK